jgi:hypothetical protein
MKNNYLSHRFFTAFHNLPQTPHFQQEKCGFLAVKSPLKITSTAAFSVHLSEYIFTTPN